MELKSTFYAAILNKTNFTGYYTRYFLFPEKLRGLVSPEWYYLNRLDLTGCLKMVLPFDELHDESQKARFLTFGCPGVLDIICVTCGHIHLVGDEWVGGLENDLEARYASTTVRALCPSCFSHTLHGAGL